MITGLITLLACQLVGEFIVKALSLPIPGPVIGLILLFIILRIRRPAADSGINRAGDGLLRHLQLLFIPAGVGVVAYLSTLTDQWLPVLAGLVLSWVLVIALTAGAGSGSLWLQAKLSRGPGRTRDAETRSGVEQIVKHAP